MKIIIQLVVEGTAVPNNAILDLQMAIVDHGYVILECKHKEVED